MSINKSMFEISEKMQWLQRGIAEVTIEEVQGVTRLLQKFGAMDLAPMLGLAKSLEVTNASSGSDSKLPSPVVR